MTTDRNYDDQLGATVRGAYRPFALSEPQRRRHRERLDAAARRRDAGRLRSHIAEIATVAAIALVAIAAFLTWNSLDPGSNDDDAALADATVVKCFPDTSFSAPLEVMEHIATQWAAEDLVDCTTPFETTPTPTGFDCMSPDELRDAALSWDVPPEVTQPIYDGTIDCSPTPEVVDPTPTVFATAMVLAETPSPTATLAPFTDSNHERLYTIDLDGRLYGFDLTTGGRFLSLFVGAYADVALSPDGLTMYAISNSETDWLTAFDAVTGDEKWSAAIDYWAVGYLGDSGPPTISVSPLGDLIYIYGQDPEGDPHDPNSNFRMLSVHDAETGEVASTAPFPFRMSAENAVLYSCAASLWPSLSGDRVLAICKGGGSYNVVDMTSGELIESMADVPVSGMAVEITGAVDGTLVYVVTDQGDVAIYDRESMEVIDAVELIADARPAWSGAFLSPNGSRLYVALSSTETGAYFREIRVFDTATWEEVDRFELPFDGFGRSLAADSESNFYGIEWLSENYTRVWKRDAVTGEVTVMLVADAEVHQLLVAG
jgi:DNA-binding beta-propeller fold protein YncE